MKAYTGMGKIINLYFLNDLENLIGIAKKVIDYFKEGWWHLIVNNYVTCTRFNWYSDFYVSNFNTKNLVTIFINLKYGGIF